MEEHIANKVISLIGLTIQLGQFSVCLYVRIFGNEYLADLNALSCIQMPER